jgi:3-deoxy-D-manno-octulosonic-acid transferase
VYAAYTSVLAIGLVAALPYYLWRGRRDGRYRRTFRERCGHLPSDVRSERPSIWIHAVSVGEVLAAATLAPPLRARFPDHPLFLSTTTVTGHAVARERAGGFDGLFYAPFDFPRPVGRVLAAIRPALLVLVDTELWPNTIRETRRAGGRVALVNGRISERSFPRYRLVRRLLRRVLSHVDLFLMQSDLYARRLVEMGAPPDRVHVSGSLKFDAARAVPAPAELRERLSGPGPLLVAGSTVPGEERAVLDAHAVVRRAHPACRLLIAPRHPERAPEIEGLVRSAGLDCLRRSRMQPGDWRGPEQVTLLDTLGELAGVYALASVVFVGGSLEPRGGHNVLEAAAVGKPILVGPHMQNFHDIAELFRAEGAMLEVSGGAELGAAVAGLLDDPERARVLGERARRLVEGNRGVVARSVDALAGLLS